MTTNKFNKIPLRNPDRPKLEPFPINRNAAEIRRKLEDIKAERELQRIERNEVWNEY